VDCVVDGVDAIIDDEEDWDDDKRLKSVITENCVVVSGFSLDVFCFFFARSLSLFSCSFPFLIAFAFILS
jgi:hypothetical protein